MILPQKNIILYAVLIFSYTVLAQPKIKSTPAWVVTQSYNENPTIDPDEISDGMVLLLDDEQVHIPKEERFVRYVRKITDHVGVQDASLISINYDPTYQELVLHQVKVLRQGKTISKLNLEDFQSIRQESNAESYIYDGSLNATANLADIRKGDILDFSYTIKGFNIKDGHFSGATSLNSYYPIGKINYYLISENKLRYKIFNSDIKPVIASYKGYYTYNWQSTPTETVEFEINMPTWYIPYKSVFVSDYDDWNQVVRWGLDIYENFPALSKELLTQIQSIQDTSHSDGHLISNTLKFVQDEIRYLGLESGIGAYKPFTPNKVFEQRFGDCKDKSWLMVAMLREMGINAYPVLVSTQYGRTLEELLPSPKVFNHVVVKVIDKKGNEWYYDPTLSNQFGNYQSVSFPNYEKGLVIKKGVNSLNSIEIKSDDLVEVFDIFDMPKVGEPAKLNVMTVYHESESDYMRNQHKSSSLSSLSKGFKDYYDPYYDGVEVIKDPVFQDDSISNKFTVEENYRINEIWSPMVENKNNMATEFSPYSLLDVLVFPDTKTRKTPFALYYPTHRKHNITIKLPQSLGASADEKVNITSKYFDFSITSKMNPSRDILYVNYEYKNKKAFVAPEDYKEFYTKMKEVEDVLGYYVYMPKSPSLSTNYLKFSAETKDSISSFFITLFWIIVSIIILGIAIVVYVVVKDKKKT